MTVSDIANQIYTDLGSPTSPIAATIQIWLTAHIGDLNNALALSVVVDDSPDGVMTPDLISTEISIFILIYMAYYYRTQMNLNLGASAYDWSEITEGDSTVRRVSKNEIAKTYRGLMNDMIAQLKDQINRYRFDKSMPLSLDGVTDLHQFRRNSSV